MTNENDLIRRGDAETLLMMYVPQGQYAKAINDLRAISPARQISGDEEAKIFLAMERASKHFPAVAAREEMGASAVTLLREGTL